VYWTLTWSLIVAVHSATAIQVAIVAEKVFAGLVTSASTVTSSATAASASKSAASAASAHARCLRARLIHLDGAALEVETIKLSNGFFGVIAGTQLDEAEAAGAASVAVRNHAR
jgi:hypothetical protein